MAHDAWRPALPAGWATPSRRLALLSLLAAGAPAWSAAPAGKTWRVGYLSPGDGDLRQLKPALAEFGYVEGRNVTYESRVGGFDQADRFAQELVAARCDVMVGVLLHMVSALQRASPTIPIVMMWTSDPVGNKLVRSLARPGGNITGAITLQDLTWSKVVDIARAFAPGAPLGLLVSTRNPGHQGFATMVQDVVRRGGGKLVVHTANDRHEIDAAYEAAARAGIRVMMVGGGPPFVGAQPAMAAAGAKHRIGSAVGQVAQVNQGALFGYGMDVASYYRDVAACIDRIAGGANPATLAVTQPTLFQFVINARAAREVGLEIPAHLRISAEILN